MAHGRGSKYGGGVVTGCGSQYGGATLVGSKYAQHWTPASIAALSAWFDAAKGIGKTASAVDSWADQSGNGKTLTASSTARPTFVASDNAGLPAVSFDGAVNAMTSTVGTTSVTAFAVLSSVVGLRGPAVILSTDTCNWYGHVSTPDNTHGIYAGLEIVDGGTYSAPIAIGFTYRAFNDIDLYRGATKTHKTNGSSDLTGGGLCLGRYSGGSQQFFGCNLQELTIFSAEPSTAEISKLLAYFTAKYGV